MKNFDALPQIFFTGLKMIKANFLVNPNTSDSLNLSFRREVYVDFATEAPDPLNLASDLRLFKMMKHHEHGIRTKILGFICHITLAPGIHKFKITILWLFHSVSQT